MIIMTVLNVPILKRSLLTHRTPVSGGVETMSSITLRHLVNSRRLRGPTFSLCSS